MDVAVKLTMFEGPLDLLLHLIRKNEVDIQDIPVALITRQYLDYLELMREFNISLAGDFLVMASTLIHIKSRMLLPTYDSSAGDGEEDDDPRADLVDRLREHMRIKAAAETLLGRHWLDRDVFTRGDGRQEVEEAVKDREEIVEAGVFDLVEAFRSLLAERGKRLVLGVPAARVSLEDRMSQLLEMLKKAKSISFEDCFSGAAARGDLVVTFLALLELTRMGLMRVFQTRMEEPGRGDERWGRLRLAFRPLDDEDGEDGS